MSNLVIFNLLSEDHLTYVHHGQRFKYDEIRYFIRKVIIIRNRTGK